MRRVAVLLVAMVAALALGLSQVGPAAESATAAGTCAVTKPNYRPTPNGAYGRTFNHGNGGIWVVVPPRGMYDRGWGTVSRRGLIAKVAWYSIVPAGAIAIEARRLDRSAPVWRGRATQIGAVQTSGVRFADPGCWRVTGRVGGKALSYVVRVAFTRA
jgi:hypothetical protein